MYSKVSKYSPEARKRIAYRSRQGKSCGYYMRIVFLFSSLIQSLIIVSLVLFLVYGKQQDQSSLERTQELEVRFSQLSLETMDLRQQRKNLTYLINVTATQKARNDWELGQLRMAANISYMLLDDLEKKLKQCNFERLSTRPNCATEPGRTFANPFQVPQSPFGGGCNCGTQMETLKAKMQLVQSNFTQTAMQMQMEMDQISRDRDNLNLEAIQLRRDKSVHDKAIQYYQIKCKDEFVNSLSGISNVSKAFLGKIDSLFHSLSPFHITCPKQKEYLEQIRTNCTDLSEEVVSKFQAYLDTLGNRVSMYQGNISVLTAENMRMTRDYNLCSQNRTGLIREHKQNMVRVQLQNDEEKEKLLKEKIRLKGDIEVLESSLKVKDSQLNHMNEQLKLLNMSCIPRSGGIYPRFGNQPGSSFGPQVGSSNPSLLSGGNPFNRNTFGSSSSSSSSSSFGSPFGSNTNTGSSSNTGFNKPSSTGIGSSSFGSNSGFGSSSSNNQGSSNQGSSSSLFGSAFGSSSSGSSLNKQTSPGQGSSSSSSSAFGSPFASSSNNPSSSSSSQSKLGSGTSSSSFGSSSSNTGSKFGSSSSSIGSNFGSSSSNSGLGSSSSSSSSKTTSNSQGSSNSLFSSSSSSSRSSSGSSLGSSLGSSSSNQNKLSSSSTNKGSPSSSSGSSSSSSSGSSATTSKNTFGGWWGLGAGSSSSSSNTNSGSNTDQSKTGSNQGRGTSSSGNTFGSFGRTNTFSYTGPISVNQHLRDLQRIINPQGPEQKQELSRMLG